MALTFENFCQAGEGKTRDDEIKQIGQEIVDGEEARENRLESIQQWQCENFNGDDCQVKVLKRQLPITLTM